MGDRKFTFIELHLDGDTQFGPKTISEALPFGEKYEAETEDEPAIESATDEAAGTDDDSGGKGALGVVVGLVVLVGVAVALKKFRGDDDAVEEYEEPDVVVN